MAAQDDGTQMSEASESAAAGDGIQDILRILAQTQRDLVAGRKGEGNRRKLLANIKIDEFYGGRTVSSYAYRNWKKSVEVQQQLHQLSDQELALVIYSQVKGKAKQLLEVLTISDLLQDDALEMVWSLLDKSHEKTEHEREDDAYDRWEKAHRKHGQDMDEWICFVKKTKLEVLTQDPEKVISSKELASKMLRGSGLPPKERAQVLFNCGGVRDPERIETVLLVTYPRIADNERKLGMVLPKSKMHPFKSKEVGKERSRFKKVHEVHAAEQELANSDSNPELRSGNEDQFADDPDEPVSYQK